MEERCAPRILKLEREQEQLVKRLEESTNRGFGGWLHFQEKEEIRLGRRDNKKGAEESVRVK